VYLIDTAEKGSVYRINAQVGREYRENLVALSTGLAQ